MIEYNIILYLILFYLSKQIFMIFKCFIKIIIFEIIFFYYILERISSFLKYLERTIDYIIILNFIYIYL